ncbi:MAG: NAD-dependent epimerase/dehydratase family protein [Clostridia bacterium]|nr:NAD-dependent epimerase/dehydratase family protein [Clostridia bacterium]
MKKILITGANSYIGTSFETYIKENYPDDYTVDTVDMVDGSWRGKSFAGYDSVFHVAGIAHRKETKENAHLYYEVNRDLAIETAKKAKADGAGQFIFLSSMSVYGMETGVITKETKPNPKSHYGKSKWQAEQAIASLDSEDFNVCILRPPMVYGEGCKGNYQALVKIAKTLFLLPDYKNERSMISVENLSARVKRCMDERLSGVRFPQDATYVCTCEMIAGIRKKLGKSFKTVKLMNPFIRLCVKCTVKGKKAFGNLIYRDLDDLN